MAQLNLQPLDQRNLIYQTGVQQSQDIRQGIEGFFSAFEEKEKEKKAINLKALENMNVDLETFTSKKFMQDQNDLVDAFETKWAERWKSRKGLNYDDLVELSMDQRKIEKAQAKMLVDEQVFKKSYELLKSDDKGMYDKDSFQNYYSQFMTEGKVPLSTSTGIPFLEYAPVDLDSYATNLKNQYRKDFEKKGDQTYSDKGASRIYADVYNYGSEQDARSFVASQISKDPRVMTTLRKKMLSENYPVQGDTPTLDYFTEKFGVKGFVEPRKITEERPIPQSELKDKEIKTISEASGNWKFNNEPIILKGVGDSPSMNVVELNYTQPKGKPKGLYFKVIKTSPDIQSQIDAGELSPEQLEQAAYKKILGGTKATIDYIPYSDIASQVKYRFEGVDRYSKIEPSDLTRPKEETGFTKPQTISTNKKVEDLRNKYNY
jgi:hypothetical protein